MKKFIINCGIFSLLFITILIVFWWFTIGSGLKSTYTLPSDRHIVFMGNSQIQYSVDPSIMKGSINLGLNADKPEYVYAKLNLITKYNCQIDTLVIGINHLFLINNKYVKGEEILDFPDYIESWSPKDIYVLLNHYPSNYLYEEGFHVLNLMKLWGFFKSGRKGIINREIVGTFSPLHRNKLKEDLQRINQTKNKRIKTERKLSDKNIYFIEKIRKLCKENNIKLIFILPPVYQSTKIEMDILDDILNQYYSDIPRFDYRSFPIPISGFGDNTHLNYIGSEIFSEYLNQNRFRE